MSTASEGRATGEVSHDLLATAANRCPYVAKTSRADAAALPWEALCGAILESVIAAGLELVSHS